MTEPKQKKEETMEEYYSRIFDYDPDIDDDTNDPYDEEFYKELDKI